MSGNRLGVDDDADVLVEPAPDVRLALRWPGGSCEVTLSVGESTEFADVSVELVEIIKRTPVRPTPNGKNYYIITADDGSQHVEYVRTEVRAVELFQKKNPDRYIREITVK